MQLLSGFYTVYDYGGAGPGRGPRIGFAPVKERYGSDLVETTLPARPRGVRRPEPQRPQPPPPAAAAPAAAMPPAPNVAASLRLTVSNAGLIWVASVVWRILLIN